MAVIACAAFIGHSATVIVHASDYIKDVPCIRKEVDNHEVRISTVEVGQEYMKEALNRLLDAQGIDRPEEKDERTGP